MMYVRKAFTDIFASKALVISADLQQPIMGMLTSHRQQLSWRGPCHGLSTRQPERARGQAQTVYYITGRDSPLTRYGKCDKVTFHDILLSCSSSTSSSTSPVLTLIPSPFPRLLPQTIMSGQSLAKGVYVDPRYLQLRTA